MTALIFASSNGHLEIVKYLVEVGCNFNHVDFVSIADRDIKKTVEWLNCRDIKKTGELVKLFCEIEISLHRCQTLLLIGK